MFCSKCGTQNESNVTVCAKCSEPLTESKSSVKAVVPNYLVQSILVTLFCCLPFGIVALVYAAQVNSKVAANDVAGATEVSNKAKTWCWVSFWTGLGLAIFWFLLAVIGGISSQS